jgi:type II secretion system protein J
MRQCINTPRGLTLIEMMGAIAVSGILLTGAWHLFHGGIQSYQRGLREVRLTQGARTLLTLVTRDIQRAMATRAPYGLRGTPQQTVQAEGERHADHLVMIMTPASGAAGHEDQRHAEAQPSREEAQRIRYILTALPDGKTLALQRAATALGGQQPERFVPLYEPMQAFYLRYFDGQTWYDEWQQAEVPRAVEITIVLQSQGPQSRPYRFATLVTAD